MASKSTSAPATRQRAALKSDPQSTPKFEPNSIDTLLGQIRFYHVFNTVVVALLLALALRVPHLTLLPLYLALVARLPCNYLQRRYGLSFSWSVFVIALGSFLVLIASELAIVLPLVLQALQLDASDMAQIQPMLQGLIEWARSALMAFGINVQQLETKVALTPQGLFDLLTDSSGSSTKFLMQAAGVAARPVLLIALSLLVLFMANYALGYSSGLRDDIRSFLRVCWPRRTAEILERVVLHTQSFGAEVFRGYSWMVLVLGTFYFIVYLGAVVLFPEAHDLPPLIVIALVVVSGVIGAIPGLGAKVLLLVGAVSGLLVGTIAASVTGSFGLGVYIFVAVLLVTGFESKFGTPTTLGRALGVNSCLMLYLAIATIAGYGVNATLWAVFVILPLLVGGMQVMRELYDEGRGADDGA